MARILIGNIRGPVGPEGKQGPQGKQGIQGPAGPLPPLINNALTTEAGIAALDAKMGKTLGDQVTQLYSNLGNFYTKTINRDSYATAAELEDAVDRPQILFEKSEPFSYVIILSNNKGDTVYSGGISAIWGYCNGIDGSGTQVLLKFTGIFRWRSRNTPAAWSEWISPLSSTDLFSKNLGNADLDSIRDPGNYVQTISANTSTSNHYPTNIAGYLEVAANIDKSWVMQRYIIYHSGAVYIRCLYSGSWYAWSGPK